MDKNTLSYPATLTPDTEDGGFVVTFSDIPEAITQGDSIAEALQEAADCLDEAIAGRVRLGKVIPGPSNPEEGQYLIDVPAQTAIKTLLAHALSTANISKVELARRLGCNEKEVRRLLDPRHSSKLSRLEFALKALGCRLVITTEQLSSI